MYELQALAASVSGALLTVPQSIQAMKDLLGRDGDKHAAVLKELEQLRACLARFALTHDWLREAKELHDCLVNLDNALEEAHQETVKAREHGRFNADAFDVARTRRCWEASKGWAFERLVRFAEHVQQLEAAPLRRDPNGAAIDGPVWARRFVETRCDLESALLRYDAGDLNAKRDIANIMNALVSMTRSEMLRANELIRNVADVLSKELYTLSGRLDSVRV